MARRSGSKGKEMEGDNRQRRAAARDAREQGVLPSEAGITKGSSKQRTEASPAMSHQERIDLKREGKQKSLSESIPAARPGSRDRDSADRERFPRLDDSSDTSAQRRATRPTRGNTSSRNA